MINQEKEEFITNWLETLIDMKTIHTHKFETRNCYAVIKYLIDDKIPESIPTHYEMEKIYRMYDIMPVSLHAKMDTLIAYWKTKVYSDPEEYMIDFNLVETV